MKLPAVAIAAAFAGGIVLGLHTSLAGHGSSPRLLGFDFFCTAVLVLAGFVLAKSGKLLAAAIAGTLSWVLAGFLACGIAQQPRPADHITSLLEVKRIELTIPLRWHGHLRDEPARLPWGHSYDVDLSSVDYAGEAIRVRGGLRLGFTPQPDTKGMPELHAGDEISVLTAAMLPRIYKDEGAFDRRAYLSQQNIDLLATLRAPELLERVAVGRATPAMWLARWRRSLRDEADQLFASSPPTAGVLRAMLLGDRSFVDRNESVDFQKTGVFHVLVVAGLHVGALAFSLFWLARKLKISNLLATFVILGVVFSYVAVVEQRPPVLRAALMVAVVVIGQLFYRRLELLNSAALAALILLIANPTAVQDTSFQLSFAAIGCIAGLAVPWLERSVQPYARALRGWRDVSRDAAHQPQQIQFRIDLRSFAGWVASRAPRRASGIAENGLVGGIGLAFRIWELLMVSVVLQVGMLPLMARDFHRVPLTGAFANLAAVPLTGVIVPAGFVTLAVGLVIPALGKVLAVPVAWLTTAMMHVVHWFAQFPAGGYRIPGPPFWLLVAFFCIVFVLAVAARQQSRFGSRLASVAAGLLALSAIIVAAYPFSPHRVAGQLEVNILDVGQGDSIFVVSPVGGTLLVDGGGAFQGFPGHEEHLGPDPGEDAVSPYLWSRGFKKLDVIALTHAHQDHVGGLRAILENFHVGRLWVSREVGASALARLEEVVRRKNIPIEYAVRGKSFEWGGVAGTLLWPDNLLHDASNTAKNNDSLVMRLQYGQRSILLPGDAEKQAEYSMLSESGAGELHADVLKIGHHGSKNSTMPEFLTAVHPRLAIISAGLNNPYGHPSPELLERLEQAGIRILRTDRDGAVHVLTDGKQINVSCYVACPETEVVESSGQAPSPNQQ